MPNRILREGILTSERVALLAWPEEVFYRRLMSLVDDFGRYYAKESLLRAHLYPLQLDKVSDSDIGKWLTACVNAALVRVYPAKDGKRYLELADFRQQVRAKESKFPAFDPQMQDNCESGAQQLLLKCIAPAHLDVSVDGDGDVSEGVRPTALSAGPTGGPGQSRVPACPYTDIVALYHEVLPELPKARVMDEPRKKAIASLWKFILTTSKSDGQPRATTAVEAMEWLRGYFVRARDNDFIMARTPRSAEHANWKASIEYLCSSKGLKQVIEKTVETQA